MSEFDRQMRAVSDIKELTASKAKEILTELYPFLVAIASVIFTVVSQLFEYGFGNPLQSPKFWLSLGRNILTTSAAYIVFVKHGNTMYKMMNTAYQQNLKVWGEMSAKIRASSPLQFVDYCKNYTRQAQEDNRRARFERKCLIPWDEFNAVYRRATDKEIEAMLTEGKISPCEAKAIKGAQKPLKVSFIDPVTILCGSDTVRIESVASQRQNYSLQAIILRPFVMVLVNVGLAFMTSGEVTLNTAAVWLDIVTSCFMIMSACIMGDLSGDGAAKKENASIKSRIFFIDGFLQETTPSV